MIKGIFLYLTSKKETVMKTLKTLAGLFFFTWLATVMVCAAFALGLITGLFKALVDCVKFLVALVEALVFQGAAYVIRSMRRLYRFIDRCFA
jgi:ribose/xylose/arabinose/galactoside ABC-type transport system permease subunit